jgi:hypothetical protein
MVFAVTMNSKANALLALMIATNFVELKGQVYKRTDTNKLWTLACQVKLCRANIAERFMCGQQITQHVLLQHQRLQTCKTCKKLWMLICKTLPLAGHCGAR